MTAADVAGLLPAARRVMDTCKYQAVLEAILCPAQEGRRYFYGNRSRPGLEIAVMNNGSGDDYAVALDADKGMVIVGFDHESPMSPYVNHEVWPGVLDSVPASLGDLLRESAAYDEDGLPAATFCLWWEGPELGWRTGDIDYPSGSDPDGAVRLLDVLLDATPERFRTYAEDQYGRLVDIAAVRHIYDGLPLTQEVVVALNPDLGLEAISDEIVAMGYAVSDASDD